jgi:hypothetical protein
LKLNLRKLLKPNWYNLQAVARSRLPEPIEPEQAEIPIYGEEKNIGLERE